MAMTHERLAVSSGLHTILTNYRFSGSPNLQNPQPTTSLLEKKRYPQKMYPRKSQIFFYKKDILQSCHRPVVWIKSSFLPSL